MGGFSPLILHGPHGNVALTKQEVIACSGSNAIAIGSFVDSAGAAVASNTNTAVYIVVGIRLSDGLTPKRNGYLTGTEATAAAHYLVVLPLGGLILEMEEDGDGGYISATELFGTNKYAAIIVTAPADTTEDEKSETPQVAHANIKIDSSSLTSSVGSLLLEILGVQDYANATKNSTITTTMPAAWTDATGSLGRRFRCKVYDTVVANYQNE